ncbi:uncharacterized protein LODBEIA_P39990 [Lodderomyces beijingensis]|uniref:LicD/FKTN/FKRP nucleotidyltransferase domain-containing protein n=1 Tax=Lodderomyces beijingensis TaxID=1775926 RepID=A0ABP0ZNP4_9ASCO
MYQDNRLTFGLILQHLNENQSSNQDTKTIPFDWRDWIDFTYFNTQLAKPAEERIKCEDIYHHINFVTPSNEKIAKKNSRLWGCINSYDLTTTEMARMGFKNADHLPGFVQFKYAPFTASECVRNLQGKSYLLTKQPIPYKVIFLNDRGEDLIYDVRKGRILELATTYEDRIDPVEQFDRLISSLNNSNDNNNNNNNNNNYNYKPKPLLEIPESSFRYDRSKARKIAKRLEQKQTVLTRNEKSFLDSISTTFSATPNKNSESRYFKEATMRLNDGNRDSGWHYDWRFFNGKLSYNNHRTAIILERLMRNWFKFTTKHNIVSWIAHGPLLSWYWNGGVFPFDNDLDMQMPIEHLIKLGELFNQTIVVEDMHEGFGKYMIDVGTFIHNRKISERGNHIDARFIDIETGVYIDLTGISSSGAVPPGKCYQNIQDDKDEGPLLQHEEETFNDRRVHFYHFSQISPLKLSMIDGVPCYVPNSIIKRLKYEYAEDSLARSDYDDWFFVPRLGNWIHFDDLEQVFKPEDYIKANGRKNKHRFLRLIDNLSDQEIYQLLIKSSAETGISRSNSVLINFYKAQQTFHDEEKKFLFKIDATKKRNKNDVKEGKLMDDSSKSQDEQYLKFVEERVKLSSPIRQSLFEYEKIEGSIQEFYARAERDMSQIRIKGLKKEQAAVSSQAEE